LSQIIGLTGRRHVGKSESAIWLQELGFIKCHAFEGGKAAAVGYFRHLGASEDVAHRMVHGDLRDVPSPLLPDNQTPRYFLEIFGKFMGTTLGPEWTLGLELRRVRAACPGKSIIVESVVYEADCFRAAGGTIVRIIRPGHQGPTGMMTDAAEAEIAADVEIINDGSLADLKAKVLALVA